MDDYQCECGKKSICLKFHDCNPAPKYDLKEGGEKLC